MTEESFYKGQTLYRYKALNSGEEFLTVNFHLERYTVTAVTPKGGWIGTRWNAKRRFVLASGAKRYAYPTREEAWTSFKRRKECYRRILLRQLEFTNEVLKSAPNDPPKDHHP